MRDEDYFREEWARRYPGAWAEVVARHAVIAPDVAFARGSANPMDRRLAFCAWLLATIQVLEGRGESFDLIREFCLAVTVGEGVAGDIAAGAGGGFVYGA